jgi:hypothetical protein
MAKREHLEARIATLEGDLRNRDDKIKDLRSENRKAVELVDQMREHVQDGNALIERWISTFDMQQDDDGLWKWHPNHGEVWQRLADALDKNEKQVRDWNRFVGQYNATVSSQDVGRPLDAGPAQVKDVLKRRKAGASLRAVAAATNLSIRTVRTIVDKDQHTGRVGDRERGLRRRAFDKIRAAEYRVRKRQREALPKEINRVRRQGDELLKAAKGLGEV